MDKQSIANIYLADHRGLSLSDYHRSWFTFNYGQYQHPHREAPGALRVFNEETLAGRKEITYQCQATGQVLLLPLVGGISVQTKGETYEIEAGSVLELPMEKGELYRMQNPYGDLVSYLQIELERTNSVTQHQIHSIDLEQHHNTLQAIFPSNHPFRLSIGKFDGRVEGEHALSKAKKSTFVFVIDGVFEVQNRLLHARDGLYLADEAVIEFEALANEAILLIVEF